jgi:hypothetical protein
LKLLVSVNLAYHKELLRNTEADGRLEVELWHSCKSSSESTGFEASTRLDCTRLMNVVLLGRSSVHFRKTYRRFGVHHGFILHCRSTNGPLVLWRRRQNSPEATVTRLRGVKIWQSLCSPSRRNPSRRHVTVLQTADELKSDLTVEVAIGCAWVQTFRRRSSSGQGYTNHGRQVAVATKFLTVAQATKFLAVERIICCSSIWNFHYATLLPTEILMWILDYLESFCAPELRDAQNKFECRHCTGNDQRLIGDVP